MSEETFEIVTTVLSIVDRAFDMSSMNIRFTNDLILDIKRCPQKLR